MLTEEMKTKILEVVDTIEIDVDELDSFTYDRNPYELEYPLSMGSGEADWDSLREMLYEGVGRGGEMRCSAT